MTSILRVVFFSRNNLREVRNWRHSLLYFHRYSVTDHHKEQYAAVMSFRQYSSQRADCSEALMPIYRGSLTNKVRNIKILTLSTSLASILMQPFLYLKLVENGNPIPIFVTSAMIALYSFSTPPLIHFVTKKYITSVYYDTKSDKYIATTYSLLIRKKKLEFIPSDVVVPSVTGMFTTVRIKGKSYFMAEEEFDDINHYKRIMGFDKPIDFHLPENNGTVGMTVSERKLQNKD